MIITEGQIATVAAKKDLVLRYVSMTIQEEWKSLDKYGAGTFEEWTEEIESLYPEIKSFRNGSLVRLQEICSKHVNIKKSDQGLIKRLNLQFGLEATKLRKAPSLVTNIVLVEKYLTCFDPTFAFEIESMISRVMYDREVGIIPPVVTVPTPGQQARVNRPEETIDLEELFKLVETLSRINVRGPTASSNMAAAMPTAGAPLQVTEWAKAEKRIKTELTDRIEAEMAQVKDSLKVREDRMESKLNSVESGMSRIEKAFEQALNQGSFGKRETQRDPPPHRDVVQVTQQDHGRDMTFRQPNKDCFYCYLSGHMVRDCPYKREHIDGGKIVIENNRMRLGDGSPFPRWPENKSQKQRVDDYYANKTVPGAPVLMQQPYSHPMNASASQFQQDLVENLVSVYDTRDDEIRSLHVQNLIRENTGGNSYHPVATYQQNQQTIPHQGHSSSGYPQILTPAMASYQQNQYQPVQQQYQPTGYGVNNVNSYAPKPMDFQTSQPINFPSTPQVQPAGSGNIGGAFDFSQFAQMVQLVDTIRGNGGLPSTQSQFAQTRSSPDATERSPN